MGAFCNTSFLTTIWCRKHFRGMYFHPPLLTWKYLENLWKNFVSARDIPQIHLLLEKFECKKLLIKNCWDFWRNSIESPKLFFTYIQNTLEDIHWNYVKILIYKTWKFFDLRKLEFFGHFPISSNLISSEKCWCWPSVD